MCQFQHEEIRPPLTQATADWSPAREAADRSALGGLNRQKAGAMPKVLSTAKQRPPTEGPLTVNINVLNDGTVALVFPRSVTQFTASADEMAQLGMNLIKASAVAAMQHSEFTTGPRVPARKL